MRALVPAAFLLVLAACSGDDDDGAGPSTVPAASTQAPDAPTVPAATVSSSTLPTLPPPADLDALGAALLGADDIGVPDTWAIHDLDQAIMNDALAADADPFQGFLDCPGVDWRPDARWIQRTFTAPEQPLDNGLLRVDVIAAVDDVAPTPDDLAACAATSPDAGVEVAAVEVTPVAGEPLAPAGPPVPATEITLSAGPSADVPYPSAYVAVVAHHDGRTVVVSAGGLDLGVPFSDSTRELTGRILARL